MYWRANMKRGFTLAEVLITLGIIGIVAAMTLPAIIANADKNITVNKLKKNYSIINQGLKLSEVENGEYKYWPDGLEIGAEAYFKKYYEPYLKGIKKCKEELCGYSTRQPWTYANNTKFNWSVYVNNLRQFYILADGTYLQISIGRGNDIEGEYVQNATILIDLNGPKQPNRIGKDTFLFTRTQKEGIRPLCYNVQEKDIDKNCTTSGSGSCCAAKIMKDNWKIKNGYPW